jgi:hypothetical protein
MKSVTGILVAASVVFAGTIGCASVVPPSTASDVNDMPTGSFQGSYTAHPEPAPQLPVSGSFKSSYSTSPAGIPQRTVETSFDEGKNNDP